MSDFTKIESLSEAEKGTGGSYQRWSGEITAAEKELRRFQEKSRKIVKMFRAAEADSSLTDASFERKYNLFPANVNILQTSLINQVPQPTVDREFKDPTDDMGRVACEIIERALSSHNNRNFHTAELLKGVVQDMLVPGVGISWHTYDADIKHHGPQKVAELDPTAGLNIAGQEEVEPEAQSLAETLEYDEVVSEQILDEYVYWEDLLWSPCRSYEELRWIARKTYLTRDQLVKRFGKVGKEVPLDYKANRTDNSVEAKNMIMQQAVVYEIWDKPSEKVIWFSKGLDKLLGEKDDFLELDDFFPCPVPLVSTVSNGQYVPIPDYHYAKDQYRELNDINTRISILVRACRLAGVYDKASSQVQALLSNAAENQLVPVDQWAAFAEKGGIKGVIDWIPLDMVVLTIDQLTKNREDVKNQIYEITGMSDIIRGATKASETLGAQKIKTAYASMRIQQRQKNVVQYCSSVFDIQAQIMRKHFDIAEICKLAQCDFMNEDPQIIEQAKQLIKQPEFILRCRVESDSLSDIDFQAEKQDRMEYMGTITNFLKEILPTMNSDPIMGPFLMQLLQFSLAGFKVGKKFEGELDRTFSALQKKLAEPQQPQPSPEEQKVQGQLKLMEMKGESDAKLSQQKLQFGQAEGQQKLQLKQQEGALKLHQTQQKAAVDQQVAQQRAAVDQNLGQQKLAQTQNEATIQSQVKRQEFAQEMEHSAQKHQADMQMATAFERGGKPAKEPK